LALESEKHDYYQPGLRPDHWEVDLLLENFGANGALRLLAENKVNHALDVSWDFTPLVESGWATRDEFRQDHCQTAIPDCDRGQSDAKILQKPLSYSVLIFRISLGSWTWGGISLSELEICTDLHKG